MNWSSADDVHVPLLVGSMKKKVPQFGFHLSLFFHLLLIETLNPIFLLCLTFTDAEGCAYNLTICTE